MARWRPLPLPLPDYETDEEAGAAGAVLGGDLRNGARFLVPRRDALAQPRTLALFEEWFELRFYPLIEDLVEEPLERDEADEEFLGRCGT